MRLLDETSQSVRRDGRAYRNGLRLLPAVGVLILIGLALYASQASLLPAKTALAALAQQKQDDKVLAQAAKAVEAGKTFLDRLDESQRSDALLDFNSAKRSGWSNLPVGAVPRNGVRMGDLDKRQRAAALGLLAAVLSKDGYQKVIDIMDADQQLATGK